MTYKKIAQLANVSVSTVSKALSGSKEVSDELRNNIIKIAIENGYFEKKQNVKIEYSKSSFVTIGIICPEIKSVSYADEITLIKNEIEKRGSVAAVYVYDFSEEKLGKIIEAVTVGKRADGIILFPMNEFKINTAIPTVQIGKSRNNYDAVYCDTDEYFNEIVKYLKGLNHTEIAFAGETYTGRKFEAYKRALALNGLKYNPDNVYIINERFEQIGYSVAELLMQKPVMPSAVICAYDEIALGLIHILSENGIRIPDMLSVVGINDIPMSEYSSIPLTTVRIFGKEQAKTAVDLLYKKIFGKFENIINIKTEYKLIERNSTALKKES